MTFLDEVFTQQQGASKKRQRALLITIDYEGYGFRENGDVFRGRAVSIYAPEEFSFRDRNSGDVLQIDREISHDVLRGDRDPERIKEHEFSYMEAELLRNARELTNEGGPTTTLIPTRAHNVVVRNHALRWKAMATRLRRERGAAEQILAQRDCFDDDGPEGKVSEV